MSSMTTIDDLPAPVVRLITRYARTRHIPGTNRFARVCRSWRDAAVDSDEQEQLQLLLALEGLPPDAVTSTSAWLAHHGTCVDALHIIYNPATAALYQQLPLATAPLVSLARLEVDGPDSLVALAPALPQLVALTHLGASISVVAVDRSEPICWSREGVFCAHGVPLETPPCLQQLCPGLKSLRLDMGREYRWVWLPAPVAQLLPDHLEQLHIPYGGPDGDIVLHCGTLARYTHLRCLSLSHTFLVEPDQLLLMPALKEVDIEYVEGVKNDRPVSWWFSWGLWAAPQHCTKLAGLGISSLSPEQCETLSGLRKLHMELWVPDEAERVLQLSGLSCLQHLTVNSYVDRGAEPALSALSSVQQLTCLGLYGDIEVPRSTWAAMLPHLTQLRVLDVGMGLLLEGRLAEELVQLTRLQCLYVAMGPAGRIKDTELATTGAEMVPHLQMLSACSSLRAVLCWWSAHEEDAAACPMWEYVHEGRLHLSCWYGWGAAAGEGRVVLPRSCPHLPGVWELQQEPADGLSSN